LLQCLLISRAVLLSVQFKLFVDFCSLLQCLLISRAVLLSVQCYIVC